MSIPTLVGLADRPFAGEEGIDERSGQEGRMIGGLCCCC